MRRLQFTRWSALVVGIFLPSFETWRRWGTGSTFSSWFDDVLAGMLLLYAWHAGRREPLRSRAYLMAGWGYTLGIAYMSFFGQLQQRQGVDVSGFPNTWAIAFKGFGLAFAALNLAAAWPSRKG